MIVRFFSRSVFLPALLPLALAACVSSEPAIANPPPAPPLGVNLGGAPARSTGAVELASASSASMAQMNHAGHGTGADQIQMAHEGHAGAHGAGTVTAVNVAQRRIGMQHEPIPALGWPSMSDGIRGRAVGQSASRSARIAGQFLDREGTRWHVCHPIDPAGRGCSMTPPISRRRFVQGIAAAGVLAAVPWPLRGFAAGSPAPVLSGTDFDLEIGELPVNITGRPRTAVAVNGQVPAPILRWREGDTVTLRVTNRLAEPTSIHWHGILLPNPMDGVPGLTFNGIAPGETFTYQFPVRQSGTYWYHSHSGFQEQQGLYGPLVIEPKAGYPQAFDRDYVVFLSDWTDENPHTVMGNLKFQADYYNRQQRTLGTFIQDVSRQGLAATISDRLMWGEMRMSPTDILDINGTTYTYLINGQPPAANWTALFRPGERVRLRFINGSAMSIFDVRIPDLPMTIVQADGIDVRPVAVDEFRIGTAETYDVIVEPREDRAFTLFVQAEDRSGFASATLAPRPGMAAPVPPLDPRPMRTMADMGMEHGSGGMQMDHGAMSGMSHGNVATAPTAAAVHANHSATPAAAGMDGGAHAGRCACRTMAAMGNGRTARPLISKARSASTMSR